MVYETNAVCVRTDNGGNRWHNVVIHFRALGSQLCQQNESMRRLFDVFVFFSAGGGGSLCFVVGEGGGGLE